MALSSPRTDDTHNTTLSRAISLARKDLKQAQTTQPGKPGRKFTLGTKLAPIRENGSFSPERQATQNTSTTTETASRRSTKSGASQEDIDAHIRELALKAEIMRQQLMKAADNEGV